MMDYMKGKITKEYTVWCGNCVEWHQEAIVRNQKEAIRKFKENAGWKQHKEYGWLCPECSKRVH